MRPAGLREAWAGKLRPRTYARLTNSRPCPFAPKPPRVTHRAAGRVPVDLHLVAPRGRRRTPTANFRAGSRAKESGPRRRDFGAVVGHPGPRELSVVTRMLVVDEVGNTWEGGSRMSHNEDQFEGSHEAWKAFRNHLADRIDLHDEFDHVLYEFDVPERFETPCGPYIQVGWSGDDDIVAELSSNRVLDPKFRIRKSERRLLREAGWRRPDDDHLNYWLDVDSNHSDHAADMLMRAMRDVFGVVHPAFLIDRFHEECESAGTDAIQTTHKLPIAVMPDHPDHLQELIGMALGSDWGHPTPERDEDGDIPYFCDSTVVFVRVVADAPVIRIFCELVVEVEDLESGAFEVAVLNRDHSAVKFVLRDTRILMSIDLPALPFAPEHLRTILSGMCELAPKIDADLAHRVRGRRFFEPSTDEAA